MTYLQQRVYNELGVPEELNKVLIHGEDRFGLPTDIEMPIFTSTKKDDIDILVYTLDRTLIEYDHPDATPEHKNINNDRKQHYHLTRLHPDRVKDGAKYIMPKGKGVYPFIPPMLLEAYEKKAHIPVLYITEGYFKAFKGSIHGLPIVGLSSITHYANSKTKRIHAAISTLIETCGVKHVVMLYDGDCLNISTKAIEQKEDLAKRPQGFLSSILQVRELLGDYSVDVWFAHINTAELNNEPKGLDDMLCEYKGNEEQIVKELLRLSTPTQYIEKMNVSVNIKKLQPYFNLKSVDQFYNYWADAIKDREFIYFGSTYQWNDKQKRVEKTIPRELKNFIRVGDYYYERVEKPIPYTSNYEGELEIELTQRMKSTITDDYGRELIKKIPKYKAFVNIPSHTNYQQVIHNCWNKYAPFPYTPEPGDWTTTQMFLRHIFGEQYQFGLDYLQILYMYPNQLLPVLCLVSQERQTGKTTFLDYLARLFPGNAAIVGQAYLASQFNGLMAAKLILGIDETNVEKNREFTEMIKLISTSKKIVVNNKGQNQYEMWNYMKVIITSNFETNFIYTQDDEIRFWVRKIPHIQTIAPNLLNDMCEEIPAFLAYLSSRKISVPNTTRMWFEQSDLETEALRQLKQQQKPLLEKEIIAWARELFFAHPDEEYIYINHQVLRTYIDSISTKESTSKINKVIKDMNLPREDTVKRARIPEWEMTLAGHYMKKYRTFPPARVHTITRDLVLTKSEIEELTKQKQQ